MPFQYPFAKSQIANNDTIDTEILLADTDYGQGEVLISSLHLSLIHGALVNEGQMMTPSLENAEQNSEVWKDAVFTEENREILLDALIATVEHPDGTGRLAKIEGVKLAGKTSTVELKGKQKERGQENGWFVGLNVEKPEIVLSMMIGDIGDRGGSANTVQKVRNVLADYFD